jgi:aspartate-semialdehyde dehydrogenase
VNVECEKEFEISDVRKILEKTPGVIMMDDPKNNVYPMPLISHDRDEVFVGRLRRDESQPRTMNMWVVSDNLRKGAATNAIQIAEYLVKEKLV